MVEYKEYVPLRLELVMGSSYDVKRFEMIYSSITARLFVVKKVVVEFDWSMGSKQRSIIILDFIKAVCNSSWQRWQQIRKLKLLFSMQSYCTQLLIQSNNLKNFAQSTNYLTHNISYNVI